MRDFVSLLARARQDVDAAVDIWAQLLEEHLGERLLCLYAKGSALKAWDNAIDYVPELSDVDMHVLTSLKGGLFEGADSDFVDALALTERYESRFNALRPDALHLPRMQVTMLNTFVDDPTFVAAHRSDVRLLKGEFPEYSPKTIEEIRTIDFNNLMGLGELLSDLPRQASDRSGWDFWSLIRRMSWRVSPSPVRLLSILHEDPMEAWRWNRSTVARALVEEGYGHISISYRAYYLAAWEMYLTDFKDANVQRELLKRGYEILKACHDAASSLSQSGKVQLN